MKTDKQIPNPKQPKVRFVKPGQVLYVPSWPERFAILFGRRNVVFNVAVLTEHKPGVCDVQTTFNLTKDRALGAPLPPPVDLSQPPANTEGK